MQPLESMWDEQPPSPASFAEVIGDDFPIFQNGPQLKEWAQPQAPPSLGEFQQLDVEAEASGLQPSDCLLDWDFHSLAGKHRVGEPFST
jgi:hypothetical protein